MRVLVSLLVLVRLCNIASHVKRYVMELSVFLGYHEKGNAHSLSLSGHEHYPYNSMDQNNLAHGVYNVA